ncbi:MAG: SMI1/KNR4 family protein [Lachnospiraceae bacterium]|nr:SMI1/KNR4 family protein [Lachnospiraceae bacterium]
MSPQEEKEFIEQAFQKLKERGWFSGQEFEPSAITEQEIAAFEREHQVTLPSLYKAFLTAFWLPEKEFNSICSVIEYDGDLDPLWLMIDSPRTMGDVSERMEILQEIREFCELPEDCFRNLIPIGDWGAGWGSLCIDLSKPESEVDEDREQTWSLVWFDHEEFDWDKRYLGKDGLLHGRSALPNLKILLEWYFYGALEDKFEQEAGIKPAYEWYQDTLKR